MIYIFIFHVIPTNIASKKHKLITQKTVVSNLLGCIRMINIVVFMTNLQIISFLVKFVDCLNTPPITCNLTTLTCDNMYREGFCKFHWKKFKGCSDNQAGIVEDYCQRECKLCGTGILLYIYIERFYIYIKVELIWSYLL